MSRFSRDTSLVSEVGRRSPLPPAFQRPRIAQKRRSRPTRPPVQPRTRMGPRERGTDLVERSRPSRTRAYHAKVAKRQLRRRQARARRSRFLALRAQKKVRIPPLPRKARLMIPELAPRPNDRRGFIHKKLGGLARRALGVVGAVGIPGISGGARLARSFLRGGSRSRAFVEARGAQKQRGRIARQNQASRFGRGGNALEQAVAARSFGAEVDAQRIAPLEGDTCPTGYHLNKSTYRLLKTGELILEGTVCVKNRRRNPDNGRASMRAARRLIGRQKHADQVDKALRTLAKPRRSSRRAPAPSRGGPIVVAS